MNIIRNVFHAFGLSATAAMYQPIYLIKMFLENSFYNGRKCSCWRKNQFANIGVNFLVMKLYNYFIRHAVFANVRSVLESAGSSWNQIVDVTVFLTNMKEDFSKYNQVYNDYFKDVEACRTTVEVKSLPTPIAIELKVIATV